MTDVEKLKNEEIEQLSESNGVDDIFDLDVLITEGVNAKVPLNFTYPNTDKTVGVMIRPLSTEEYKTAIQKAKKLKKVVFFELLKLGLYKMDGSKFPNEVLEELPFGVVTFIAGNIHRISGMDLTDNTGNGNDMNLNEIVSSMLGF